METIADPHHLAAYLVAGLLITVFVMIFTNRLFFYREQEVKWQANQLNTQLALVLSSNDIQVWTYDINKKVYVLLDEEGKPHTEYATIDFAQLFSHEDFSELRKDIAAIQHGEKTGSNMLVRSKRKEDGKRRIYEVKLSVLHCDKTGTPSVLIGTQQDITETNTRREEARKLAMRFHTVFNSSLVDMIYYDENGILTDINDKACETFNVSSREALLKRKVKFNDIPAYGNIDFRTVESLNMSSILNFDKVKQESEKIPEAKMSGKFYYETTVNSVRDESGRLHGIIAAGRNITEMVQSHHRQQEARKLLETTTHNIQDYIDNINYTLRVSGVRLINYYPDNHELEIFSDLNKAEYRLPQIRCASLVDECDRRRVRGLLRRMDKRREGTVTEVFQTRFRDSHGRTIYQAASIIPVTDKSGRITHYFGMLRDDTEMHYTETKLREETLKAQETEELKNTFLLNMSYEIRTPLNAVLGFAELFNGPHDEADEPVFAEEIKRNTGELLALINDILFISRLDARMVEFNFHECDFATLFDGYCYMGWSTLNPGVNVSVENPYSHLMITIDELNLGMVIQKLCTLAANRTTEGTVRAKCEYRHGELNITLEDTGKGMSQEALAHLFERFARDENVQSNGTGLDMPIIKELVEQMGGNLEVQSEPGKGSTVYVIIPCKLSNMEKKAEITN